MGKSGCEPRQSSALYGGVGGGGREHEGRHHQAQPLPVLAQTLGHTLDPRSPQIQPLAPKAPQVVPAGWIWGTSGTV